MSQLHSVGFMGDWKIKETIGWLHKNGLVPIKQAHIYEKDGKTTQIRYRIRDPRIFRRFVTKRVKAHNDKIVNLILGFR